MSELLLISEDSNTANIAERELSFTQGLYKTHVHYLYTYLNLYIRYTKLSE